MLQEDGRLLLHNHLRFTILYHRDAETDLSRIVGFEVEPFSVKHKYDGKYNADKPALKTCNPGSTKFVSEADDKQEVKEKEEVVFTYDVSFKARRLSIGQGAGCAFVVCGQQAPARATSPRKSRGRSCGV